MLLGGSIIEILEVLQNFYPKTYLYTHNTVRVITTVGVKIVRTDQTYILFTDINGFCFPVKNI